MCVVALRHALSNPHPDTQKICLHAARNAGEQALSLHSLSSVLFSGNRTRPPFLPIFLVVLLILARKEAGDGRLLEAALVAVGGRGGAGGVVVLYAAHCTDQKKEA